MAEDTGTVLNNGLKMVGEIVLPGGGLMLDGRVGSGLLHTAVGLTALALLGPVVGPIARLLVSANSFTQATSERNVWSSGSSDSAPPPPEAPPSRRAAAAP